MSTLPQQAHTLVLAVTECTSAILLPWSSETSSVLLVLQRAIALGDVWATIASHHSLRQGGLDLPLFSQHKHPSAFARRQRKRLLVVVKNWQAFLFHVPSDIGVAAAPGAGEALGALARVPTVDCFFIIEVDRARSKSVRSM